MKYKTVMWRAYPFIAGDREYRINTTDPEVAKRLRKRQNSKSIVHYYNQRRWDYRISLSSKKNAIRTLGRITRQKIKYDAVNNEFYADYGSIVDSKKRLETS